MWRYCLVLACSLTVFADATPFDPYRDPRWTGGVEWIGEYLSLRPRLSDLNYVISDPRQYAASSNEVYTLASLPKGTGQGIRPQRDNGFRIGVAAVPGRGFHDVTLAYAGLWTRDDQAYLNPTPVVKNSNQILQGGLWPTLCFTDHLTTRLNASSIRGDIGVNIQPASAKVGLRTQWSCVDGECGRRWIRACDLWLRAFVGIRGVFIQVREHADYHGIVVINEVPLETQEQDIHVARRSQAWGVGPRIGLDARYDIAAGVGLGAHGALGVYAGGRRHDLREHSLGLPSIPNSTLVFDRHSTSDSQQAGTVFPGIDVRLGANYLSCSGSRYSMFVEVGYNVTAFVNAFRNYTFTNAGDPNNSVSRGFTLTGLYVSAVLRY